MSKNIHICPVGFFPEPILKAVGGILPMDKFYFLYNKHERIIETLESVKDALIRVNITDLEEVEVDPYDYNNVMSAIMRIYHDECEANPEDKPNFYINFTSGTNIVAGACCSVSYYIGATLYYVMDEKYFPDLPKDQMVRIIKTPRIPDPDKMKAFPRYLLEEICKYSREHEEGISLKSLSDAAQASPQKINHYINAFLENGLITKKKEGRNVLFSPTDQGKMFADWIKDTSDVPKQ